MSDFDELLQSQRKDDDDKLEPVQEAADALIDEPEEAVVTSTGFVKQAGTTGGDVHTFANELRLSAERSLYLFCKAILGRTYLTPNLHKPICNWLQAVPPQRKMLLMPRGHCKSSIVSHCLPLHILIQDRASNIYFPGKDGFEQRIMVVCQTDGRARKHLSPVIKALNENKLLRTLWPHLVWDKPRAEAPVWSQNELTVPRAGSWPDPTLSALGWGGSATGSHPSVIIKDDLIAEREAQSVIEMESAMEWHRGSRSMINADGDLEFIIGTRWRTDDIYQQIMDNDPTVEIMVRRAIENDLPIWPEGFSLSKLEEAKIEHGQRLFSLLYMNTEEDSSLTDFNEYDRRYFEFVNDGKAISFVENEHDEKLYETFDERRPPTVQRGMPLSQAYKMLRHGVRWN